ncbi:MAG: hypothetical protein ACQEUN_16555 [Pseudomonadota bacterium]
MKHQDGEKAEGSMPSMSVEVQRLASRLDEQETSLVRCLEELDALRQRLEQELADRVSLRQTLEALRQRTAAEPAPGSPQAEDDDAPAEHEKGLEHADRHEPFDVLELSRKQRKAQLEYGKLLRESELFDAAWYLAHNPDVQGSRHYAKAPHEHYLMYGGFEGRNPSPHFHSAFYLQQYPDVAENRLNPLVHYLLHGQQEGRRSAPE